MDVIIVKALVRRKGKYLLLRKVRDAVKSNEGKWDTPGGKVKTGESQRMAIRREIYEETGLPCKIVGELPELNIQNGQFLNKTYVFVVESETETVKLSSEHDYYVWATPLEIGKMPDVIFSEELLKSLGLAEKIK